MKPELTAVVRYHGEEESPILLVASIQLNSRTIQSREFFVHDFDETEDMVDAVLGYFLEFGLRDLKNDITQDLRILPMDYRPDKIIIH